MSVYRILSFDGGGMKGLLTISLLERLERQAPGWIDQVDMLAGTSTGAIIAVGLAVGASPGDLHQHYSTLAGEIFCKGRRTTRRRLRNLFRADYDTEAITNVMRRMLGDTRLKDLRKNILITTFDLDNHSSEYGERCWEPKFLHNLMDDGGPADLPVYKAILYSCATPVYFPSVDGYIDGAVTSQNPSLAAIAHAVDKTIIRDHAPEIDNIVLLSIGCGKANRFLPGQRHNWGYAQWTRLLVDMMLEGSVDLADSVSSSLLGTRYHRICPELPATIHADEWWKCDELLDLADDFDLTPSLHWLQRSWLSPEA